MTNNLRVLQCPQCQAIQPFMQKGNVIVISPCTCGYDGEFVLIKIGG